MPASAANLAGALPCSGMGMTPWYFRRFLERADRDASSVCLELHSGGRKVSFEEMERGISSAAALLAGNGVRAGDIVLIFPQHDPGTFFAFFGAQLLGAIPSFMSPPTSRQPADLWARDHAALIARIHPALLVWGNGIRAGIAQLGASRVLTTADFETLSPTPNMREYHRLEPDRIAFLQHSSGTTGLKKGVEVTYRQLQAQVESYASVLGVTHEDCVVSWLPVYHDMGLIAATLMPFALGLPIALLDPMHWLEEPSSYLMLLASRPNSFWWLPNFAFPFLAQRVSLSADADLSQVRAIVNCSEPCKASSMASFYGRFGAHGLPGSAIRVCYAMAEYVFAVTQTEGAARVLSIDPAIFDSEHRAVPKPNGRPVVSVGRPLPETEIRVGNGLGDGEVAEVCVRGHSFCSGYHLAPEITAQKFADGWYRTGDLGFLHEGELYITGRLDDVIIVRGKNLYAHDVEMLATESGLVRAGRAVAFGVEDAEVGTEKLIVVVEVREAGKQRATAKAIRAAVLETYGLSPADVLLVPPDTLVKTSSGKVSRSENRSRYIAKLLEPWGGQTAKEGLRAS